MRTRTGILPAILAILAILIGVVPGARAQNPLRSPSEGVEARFDPSQPVLHYTLRVDPADLSGLEVELRLRNVPPTFRVALYAHPEYDDRYWRFLESLRVETGGSGASVAREDSALWRVTAPGGSALLRYRVRFPASPDQRRGAWRPFLAPTGGLIGGAHSFLYVVGATLAPAHVTLELPPGWETATGLEATSGPSTFFAPSTGVLVDAPFLVGSFRSWRFEVDGVPHRVVYWPLPNATPFDTAGLVRDIGTLVRETIALFGRAPYREYTFLLQDGAFGALEHLNSVTIGATSAGLAASSKDLLGTISHEYFHTWNLMRIRPAEYGDVDYRPAPRARGLWWSEGVTMLYHDLLLRRARLPVYDSTRAAHLGGLIGRYLGSPGNSRFSPERVSQVAEGPPGQLGDYDASTHLQGELLGAMLDLIIRDASGGRRSLDDAMRLMFSRFGGERGFTGADVERTVGDVCRCDVHPFFEEHVRGNRPIEFDRYLRLIGLRTSVSWIEATDPDGRPTPDLRAYAWQPAEGGAAALGITDPSSCWGKAGLHTGDRIKSFRDTVVTSAGVFRAMIARLRVGDSVAIEVGRPSGPWRTRVVIGGYERPSVRIEEIPGATEGERALRAAWSAGRP